MELFQVPSRDWVTASLIAGRWEYGSQSTSRDPGSASRVISPSARYLIGAEACSTSQLTGKESCSGAVVGSVGSSSAAVPGAVTSYVLDVEGTGHPASGLMRAADSAGKNSRFSGGR